MLRSKVFQDERMPTATDMKNPIDPTRRDVLLASAAGAVVAGAGEAQAAPVAPHLPHAKPEEIGLDAKQLKVAFDLLEKWTTGKDASVPGGAIIVGRHGKVVAPRFFGRQGPEADAPPIREDAMFLLASITKPITYLGAMLLVERGLLNLTDPVVRYVPRIQGQGQGSRAGAASLHAHFGAA